MTGVYLHFLNGPQKHQTLLLPEGDIVCGTGAECDVQLVLDDAGSDFTLRCEEGVIRLVSGNAWHCAEQAGEGDVLPVGTAIDVAGCRFLLSPDSAPELPAELPVPYVAPPVAIPFLHFLTRKRTGLALALLVVLAVIAGVMALLHQPAPTTAPSAIARQWLAQQQQHTLPGLALNWQSADRVTLSGYYPDENALRPLLQVMKQNGIRYRLQAFNEEDLREGVRYLAARAGYDDLQVLAGKQPGDVDIAGAIIADETWRKFLRELKTVDGLRNWEVKNIAMMNTADLLTLVKEQGLLGRVSIERDKQLYTITGLLTEAQKAVLNKGMGELTGGYQDKIVFQNMEPVSPSDSIFPSPVVSVGGSRDKPFVELQDGRRLQPGARLENNYEIVAIHAKYGVDLLGDDNLLHYAFTF